MSTSYRKLIVLSLKWYDIRIHQGVLEYARDRDWDVLASPHQPLALDIPEADGQITMLGPNDRRRIQLVEKADIPVIDLGRYCDLDLPRVCPDNVMAGRMAAEEFISRGFSRFAIFNTANYWYNQERCEGFNTALKEHRYDAAEDWHLPKTDLLKSFFDPRSASGRQIRKWLTEAEKPLAVYTIEDESAAMIMRECHELGLAVPEQVALIGNNNDPLICPYTEVPLSSVDLNWEGVGHEAAARLDRLMQGGQLEDRLALVPPKGLAARKSSDTVAVKDLRVAKALSYIQDNSHRHVSVTEITKELGIPLRTLQWAFQRSVNCSIQDEISKRRLERVKEMLLNTDRNVGQISEDLGFSSAQYMNHFFVKMTGTSPNEFRKAGLNPVAKPLEPTV
jgi:LacI family transcriptional regulator